MAKKLFYLLFFVSTITFSQSETEVIGINYSNYSKSDYNNKIYNTSTQKMEFFVNYGHDLGKKSKLFYHVSYQDFNIVTKVDDLNIPQDDFFLYPKIPNYGLVTLATGIKNELKNNWNLTNFVTLTLADNFSNNKLKSNNYFRTFSFIKNKKNEQFTYGFGLYIDNVKEDIRLLPILSVVFKNEKQGLNLFFPRSLKLWRKLNKKTYVELKTNLDINTLQYENAANMNVEVFSVITNLFYNYIIKNKFKVKAGIGLPYRTYDYKVNNNYYKTVQKPAISFNLGFSYIVFQDN